MQIDRSLGFKTADLTRSWRVDHIDFIRHSARTSLCARSVQLFPQLALQNLTSADIRPPSQTKAALYLNVLFTNFSNTVFANDNHGYTKQWSNRTESRNGYKFMLYFWTTIELLRQPYIRQPTKTPVLTSTHLQSQEGTVDWMFPHHLPPPDTPRTTSSAQTCCVINTAKTETWRIWTKKAQTKETFQNSRELKGFKRNKEIK